MKSSIGRITPSVVNTYAAIASTAKSTSAPAVGDMVDVDGFDWLTLGWGAGTGTVTEYALATWITLDGTNVIELTDERRTWTAGTNAADISIRGATKALCTLYSVTGTGNCPFGANAS